MADEATIRIKVEEDSPSQTQAGPAPTAATTPAPPAPNVIGPLPVTPTAVPPTAPVPPAPELLPAQQPVMAEVSLSLQALGHSAREVKDILDKLASSGKSFQSVQEALADVYQRPPASPQATATTPAPVTAPATTPTLEQTPAAPAAAKPKEEEASAGQKVFAAADIMFGGLLRDVSQVASVFVAASKNLEKLFAPREQAAPETKVATTTAVGQPTPVTIVGPLPIPVTVATTPIQAIAPPAPEATPATAPPVPRAPKEAATPTPAVPAPAEPAAGGAIGKLALAGAAIAASVYVLSKAVSGLENAAAKAAQYNPQAAQAEAQAEIRAIMGDMRRAQQSGPELAKFITARSEMQQKFEDIKIKFLTSVQPIITSGMKILGSIFDILSPIFDLVKLIAELIAPFGDLLGNILGFIGDIMKSLRKQPGGEVGQLSPAEQFFNWGVNQPAF